MTTAYIDIEGHIENILEFGIVYAKNKSIFHSNVYYGQIVDQHEFYCGRAHVHGLNKNFLSEHGYWQDQLLEKIHNDLDLFEVTEIVGNGKDIEQLVRFLWVEEYITYRDISLPVWDIRISAIPHLQAWSAKLHKKNISGERCNIHIVHNYELSQAKKLTKDVFGAHCALYDAYEVALFDGIPPIY